MLKRERDDGPDSTQLDLAPPSEPGQLGQEALRSAPRHQTPTVVVPKAPKLQKYFKTEPKLVIFCSRLQEIFLSLAPIFTSSYMCRTAAKVLLSRQQTKKKKYGAICNVQRPHFTPFALSTTVVASLHQKHQRFSSVSHTFLPRNGIARWRSSIDTFAS